MYFKYSGCPKSGKMFCNVFQALKYDRKPCIFSLSLKFLNAKMHSVWISAYSCDRFNCLCVFYVDMTSILTAPTPQYPFAMVREFLNLFKTSCQTILLALSKHPPLSLSLSRSLSVCLPLSLSTRYSHLWNKESCSSVSGSKGHSSGHCYFLSTSPI